jgi:LSD1 subclass zinc finger protein
MPAATTTPFRCPACREPLALVAGGAEPRCARCERPAGTADGILDLVTDPALRGEADHFDAEYAGVRIGDPADPDALGQLWTSYPNAPFNRALLQRIGDVEDATVVLLGNGTLVKELHLLTRRPRALVFSDLSVAAMRAVRDHVAAADREQVLHFAAIDAQQLPFADASVDVVYGYAFVHHLPDVDRFLAEVARVLAPGGRAVFMDNAMAPLWQAAKVRVLRPLMDLAHRRNPISQEDLRVTLEGGFGVEDFAARIRAVGGEPFFERSGFVHYLATRASDIFLSPDSRARLSRRRWERRGGGWRLVVPHGRLLRTLQRIDDRLTRVPLVERNQMRLVWGFVRA